MDLAGVDLVEERHHDERVEDDGEVLRWTLRLRRHRVSATVDVKKVLTCKRRTTKQPASRIPLLGFLAHICEQNNNINENNVIFLFITRKFAKAANAHSVDISEEESFQFLKRKVFSLSFKMSSDMSGERSSTGRLFHTAEPLTSV